LEQKIRFMNNQNTMFHHPLQLGGNRQLADNFSSSVTEFIAELTLLSHHQPQLDRIELAALESYNWKPSPITVISDVPIPSAHDALRAWAKEMDDWHMDDATQYMSFDQALNALWCHGYKSKDRLIRLLHRVDFPIRFLEQEQITQKAFQKAVRIDQTRRRGTHIPQPGAATYNQATQTTIAITPA
jgi:hypothetical protein